MERVSQRSASEDGRMGPNAKTGYSGEVGLVINLNMGFWGTLHPDMRLKVQELGVVVGGRKGRLV
jgi:hypothetical protein